ncbi:hypothetical protein [Aliihoeflea sp. PC F10.4]
MSKMELALRAAEKLPPQMQDKLAEDLLHYIDKYLALQEQLAIGIEQADRGEVVSGEEVFARLRAKFAA